MIIARRLDTKPRATIQNSDIICVLLGSASSTPDTVMSLSVAAHHQSLLQVLEEKYRALNYEEAVEHGKQ